MSYIFVKNAPITLYRSRETHLWPVGPIYGQSDPKKFCAPLRGVISITHFAKKLSAWEKSTMQRCGFSKIWDAAIPGTLKRLIPPEKAMKFGRPVKSNFVILSNCHPVGSTQWNVLADKFDVVNWAVAGRRPAKKFFPHVLYFCVEMSYKIEKCPILKDVLYFSKSSVTVLNQSGWNQCH